MISAVIICFNEADRIGATLESIQWCDEIVVVDSGSTDGTQKIAESYGSKVIQRTFSGYGKQKQFACSQAIHPWILSVDSDEVVSVELSLEIRTAIVDSKHVAFKIPRRFRFLGRTFRYGSSSVDHPTRLFRSEYCRYNDAVVHESVVVQGSVGELREEILHDSYRSIDHYFQKFNEYTTKAAEALVQKNTDRSVVGSIASFPLYFIKHYLVGGHILNGKEGLLWSLLSSFYPIVKVAKAWSLKKSQQSR